MRPSLATACVGTVTDCAVPAFWPMHMRGSQRHRSEICGQSEFRDESGDAQETAVENVIRADVILVDHGQHVCEPPHISVQV